MSSISKRFLDGYHTPKLYYILGIKWMRPNYLLSHGSWGHTFWILALSWYKDVWIEDLSFPLPAHTYTHCYEHTQTHSGPHRPVYTHLPLPTRMQTLMLYSPQLAVTYMYVCFLHVLSMWTDLKASDIIWTIWDTAWILNLLASFLEPWLSGACTLIHSYQSLTHWSF